MNALSSLLSAVVSNTVSPDNVPDGYVGVQEVDPVIANCVVIGMIICLVLFICYLIGYIWFSREKKPKKNKKDKERELLLKYKQLFEDGLITQEEFEAKKKQILEI